MQRRNRLLFLALGMIGLYSLLIAQFFTIQFLEGEKWAKQADKQHFFVVKEPFLRGKFYSNPSVKQGHPESSFSFIADIQKYHLHIDALAIPESAKKPMIAALKEAVHVKSQDELAFVNHFYRKSRNRRIAMWLEESQKESINAWWHGFARKEKLPRNALFFVADYQRSYPCGKLLGQVLHTIQAVKDADTHQAIPTGGLELQFNDYLKGKVGKRRLMRSPRNNLEMGEVINHPEHGADIYLTVNHCLQAIAEEELEKGVKKVKAKSGWAIVLDPYTGEILAMAQYPFFFPPDYIHYFNDPTLIEHTKVKAITDAHEPGSIMKPITIAIALMANETLRAKGQEPIFDPEEKMPTGNSHFAGRGKPLKDTHYHSFLNLEMAVMKSSNIYVARLVEQIINRLGKEWYRERLMDFGFGTKTEIELPSESRGLLPTPGKKHPNGALEWSQSTPYSLAMGHNIQASTLQMARAFAVFANGGYLVKPTLVKKMSKGGVEEQHEHLNGLYESPLPGNRTRVLSEWICNRLIRAMKFTTKWGGTARKGDVWGYTECGKTGTGNKAIAGAYSDFHVCSSFIGIVPLTGRRFVIAVAMDEPEYGYIPGIGKNHHGGNCSAPVFRDIATRVLEYLGIPPDDPHGYPSGDPRYEAAKADWVAEAQQLLQLYEKWNGK